MTLSSLSSRAQAFSVANLLRASPHARTHETKTEAVAPPDEHFLDVADDELRRERTTTLDDVKKEREVEGVEEEEELGEGAEAAELKIKMRETAVEVNVTRHLDDDRVESVTSCFCHGDMTFCIHPHLLNIQDEHEGSGNAIRVELLHADLWTSFHHLGTEMIITKSGRRMFPALKLRINGLNPDKNYVTRLEFLQPDSSKYRYIYSSSRWMISGTGDVMASVPSHVTSECPSSGHMINSQILSFERLKLTNSDQSKAGQVSLVSMQKFQPRVVIQEVGEKGSTTRRERYVILYKQTSFMAVTAYQNQKITTLKIASNPFAKGFRDNGKMRYPDMLMSQTPFFPSDALRVPCLPSLVPHATPLPFATLREVHVGCKRPHPQSLSSDDEIPASKISRLSETKPIHLPASHHVFLPAATAFSGVPTSLHLASSSLQHLQHFSSPTTPYLGAPYLAYDSSVKEAGALPGGSSHLSPAYGNVNFANQSRSPTPDTTPLPIGQQHVMMNSANFGHNYEFSTRLQSLRSGLPINGGKTGAPTLNLLSLRQSPQHTLPSPRPSSSSSSGNSIASEIVLNNEDESQILYSVKKENELIKPTDDRRHLYHHHHHHHLYSPSSTSVDGNGDLKKLIASDKTIAKASEIAPAPSPSGQWLSSKTNFSAESFRLYPQSHWRPYVTSDVSKCLAPQIFNQTLPRHFSHIAQQSPSIFQSHSQLIERFERQGAVIGPRTMDRSIDVENLEPIRNVLMHGTYNDRSYASRHSSHDVTDRLLVIR